MSSLQRQISFVLFALVCSRALGGPLAFSSDRWAYIDNGQVRLGFDMSAGGCIGFLSVSGSKTNLLNHWDRGRFVQQSYYGRVDGTRWSEQPWRWNPVQGGDYKGNPAKLLAERITATTAYTKSQARHWSGCVDLPEVMFEQWASLSGKVAHVRFRMTYTGTNDHPQADHEIPAVFINPALKNLLLYEGERPWQSDKLSRSVPGWPNESRKTTENWAAYVNANDDGLGAYVPASSNLTCYIFGNGDASKGACSYFAPLIRFAIKRGTVFKYDLYLIPGSATEIRDAVYLLRKESGRVSQQ